MSTEITHDVVVVGAGVAGALVSQEADGGRLARSPSRGRARQRPWSFDEYTRHLETFFAAASKSAESAWPAAPGRAAAGQPRPARWGRLFRAARPTPLRQHVHPGTGWLDAALARCVAADAAGGLRAEIPLRRRPRLAAGLRRPRAVLPPGGAGDRRRCRRRRPGPPRGRVRARLRLPDAADPAELLRHRARRGRRRHGDDGRRRASSPCRSAATPRRATRSRAATTGPSAPSTSVRQARRSARDLGQRCAGNTACTPDLPDPGEVQRGQVARPGRSEQPAGDRPGGRVEGPRRSRSPARSRASSTSATRTRPHPGTPSTSRAGVRTCSPPTRSRTPS